MTKSAILTDPTDPEEKPADGKVMDLVRIVVGCLLVVLIAGSVAFSYSSGRENRVASPAARTAQAPTSADVAQAQVDDLTVSADALQPLSPSDARSWNRALPFSRDLVRPAPRFFAPSDNVADYQRAVDCLAAAIYYEAGQESIDGKLAVAQVVLNRVRHPTYPKSVCAVVFEGSQRQTGCQFSFTCDGSMARLPSAAGWASASAIAAAALNGLVSSRVGAATHYHANYVAPYWAPRLSKLAEVGAHIFYRFPGAWSASSALTGRYAGAEPIIGKMAHFARPEIDPALAIDPALIAETPRLPDVQVSQVDLGAIDARPPVPAGAQQASGAQPVPVAVPSPAAPVSAPVVQNPLTADPTQPRRNRIARPGSW